LIYNGGTEQRGPQAVLGGHTLMARRTGAEIARRLGNALLAPILPFSPAAGHLKPLWPGTVDLPADLYARVNEAVVASMVVNGFRNVVLMGDHGGGQKELADLAHRLDAKYRPRGVHVLFCGAVYKKAQDDFNAWLKQNHYPLSTHAGIPDTSLLLYLGGDTYIRRNKLAAGDGKNGISGDARPATAELGKRYFEIRVQAAVEEIRRLAAR
jgi:creatinine amidohydrolase